MRSCGLRTLMIHAVTQHASSCVHLLTDIVEAEQQAEHSGLATARRAH